MTVATHAVVLKCEKKKQANEQTGKEKTIG
jgi:hypothetical protein